MALSGFQIESARNAREQMEAAFKRRQELLNPPAPELPQEAVAGLGSLVSSYNQAYGQARQANEQRYQQLLNISRQETQRRQGILGGMLDVAGQTTQQRATDIRQEGQERESNVMQQLARQGMSGTTVAPTLREGVRAGTEANLNRLADTMQQTKLGIMQQQAAPQRGTELGIMERRTDRFPELGALTSAFGAVGQGFGGAGTSAAIKALSKLRQG